MLAAPHYNPVATGADELANPEQAGSSAAREKDGCYVRVSVLGLQAPQAGQIRHRVLGVVSGR
jgi:hypothetical protein